MSINDNDNDDDDLNGPVGGKGHVRTVDKGDGYYDEPHFPTPDEKARAEQRAHEMRSQAFKDALTWTKRLIIETPIEIFIGAALVGATMGLTSYFNEAAKQGQIPLAYSEIDTIERAQMANGEDLPSLTRYYATLNDSVMQVFEANNLSYQNGSRGTNYAFAMALDDQMRAYNDPHARLSDYAYEMPRAAGEALDTVEIFDEAEDAVAPVIAALDEAWSERHRDVYRTETYPSTSCNSNGVCTTTIKTRSVYDYSIHTFTYYPEQGALAVDLLQNFVAQYPSVNVDEVLLLAQQTYDENRQAIYDSRQNMPDFEEPSEQDYIDFSNVWATGSNYSVLSDGIYQNHAGVIRFSPAWALAAPTSESARYRTYSRSHSGPAEFQVAEAALDYAVSMARDMERITSGMEQAADDLPALDRMVRDYVNGVLEGERGFDADEARDEIMQTARDLYSENYAGGFDVYPAKWGKVFLLTVIGMIAGGALGFGADRLIEQQRRKGRFDDRQQDRSPSYPSF